MRREPLAASNPPPAISTAAIASVTRGSAYPAMTSASVDSNGAAYYVKEELLRWHLGLAVRDWRYNVRVANIDVSDLIAGTVNLLNPLRKAYHRIQGRIRATDMRGENAASEGRTVIYMNRTVYEALGAQLTSATLNGALRLGSKELEGEEVETYRGIPIRVTDALLNTEARVI